MNTQLWNESLDRVLLDAGEFTRWLRDQCRGQVVREEAVAKLMWQLELERRLDAMPPWSVAEMHYVVMVAEPTIALAARARLREMYLAEKSSEVTDLVEQEEQAYEQERLREQEAQKATFQAGWADHSHMGRIRGGQ